MATDSDNQDESKNTGDGEFIALRARLSQEAELAELRAAAAESNLRREQALIALKELRKSS